MKIAFICDTMGPGGAERVISILSNGFIDNGHKVEIVMLSDEAQGSFYPLNKNVKLLQLNNGGNKTRSIFEKVRKLRKIIINEKPDIVIAFLSYVCIYTWRALRNTNIPFIVSERNDPKNRNWFKQLLLNFAFKKSSGCVFQTHDAFDWYKKISKDKSTVIYNPVNLTYNPPKDFIRKKQLLYVGRFNEQKNLYMLIDAFRIFNQTKHDYNLKMYGDGPLKQQIINYISKSGLTDKVIIRSSSQDWQKNEYDSAVFVLPSKFEGMPNVLAEALSLGIPAVSTNCSIGGPKELHNLFPNSLILSKDMSSNSFAEAIMEGIKISSNQNNQVPRELDSNRIIESWLEFIKCTCVKV